MRNRYTRKSRHYGGLVNTSTAKIIVDERIRIGEIAKQVSENTKAAIGYINNINRQLNAMKSMPNDHHKQLLKAQQQVYLDYITYADDAMKILYNCAKNASAHLMSGTNTSFTIKKCALPQDPIARWTEIMARPRNAVPIAPTVPVTPVAPVTVERAPYRSHASSNYFSQNDHKYILKINETAKILKNKINKRKINILKGNVTRKYKPGTNAYVNNSEQLLAKLNTAKMAYKQGRKGPLRELAGKLTQKLV